MADKSMGGPSKGTTHGGDQTAMPGQAAGKIPGGAANPLDTGAPGTGGVGMAPSDPTLTAPVPSSIYGAPTDDSDTGAPGSSGTNAGVKAGANYTMDAYGWYTFMDCNGGSVDTEAQSNKYGSDTRIPGLHTPHSTGAGGGPSISHDHTGA